MELRKSDLSCGLDPPTGNNFTPRCSTPIPLRNDERNLSSSDPYESTSKPLPSTPVSGSHNSSSSPLHQLPSTPLPVSMNLPSCESELPSSNLPGHLSGHTEHLIDSMSKACSCNSRWEQFESRFQLLEQKVDRVMTMMPQTPECKPHKSPLSPQKGEHVAKGKKGIRLFGKLSFLFQLILGKREDRQLQFVSFTIIFVGLYNSCLLFFTAEKILQDFRKFRLGPRTGRKDMDNAGQSSSHAHRFCIYMATGLPSSSISHDLRFLNQMDKLRA